MLVVAGGATAIATPARGGGSKLQPVGAKQPPAGAQLPACDPVTYEPPGGAEGACTLDQFTAVTADRGHAVALKGLTLGVGDVQPISVIKVRGGSLHPLATDAWVAVEVQVKNTSDRPAQLRDEQFNLLDGATRYHDAPEATDSERDGLTKPNKKLGSGKIRTGTLVFAVPIADAGTLSTSPGSLLFAGFGGDWGFSKFADNAFGSIRLAP
jgi:Domain of unknown function (DUF4352)